MHSIPAPVRIVAAASLWALFCGFLLKVSGGSVPALLALAVLFCIGLIWVMAATGSGIREANALTGFWVKQLAVVTAGMLILYGLFLAIPF